MQNKTVGDSEHGHDRSGLDPQSLLIVRAFCEALLSDVDEHGELLAPSAASVTPIVEQYDKLIGVGSLGVRMGIRALARLINRLPVVVLGKLVPMTDLPLAERVIFLESLEESRIGLFAATVVAFKVPLAMSFYECPEGLELMGFDPSTMWTARGRIPIPVPAPSRIDEGKA